MTRLKKNIKVEGIDAPEQPEWAELLSWPNRALYTVGDALFDDIVDESTVSTVVGVISTHECFTLPGLSRIEESITNVQLAAKVPSIINHMVESLIFAGDWDRLLKCYDTILEYYYDSVDVKEEDKIETEEDFIKSFRYYILIKSIMHLMIFKSEEIKKEKDRRNRDQ